MIFNRFISPAETQNFGLQAMHEMDGLLVGEREAKLAMIVAMASGLNVVFVGEPGCGKTTLAANAPRIIDGIDDYNIATIPPLADLTPQQLVGGQTEVTRETDVLGNGSSSEKIRTTIEPIIKPGTRVIFANELNRINPWAVNAVLEGYESGTLVTSAGSADLADLEFNVATMNPSESGDTFKVSAAAASRHSIGVEMGTNSDAERDNIIDSAFDGWEPTKISPVIDLQTLHQIQLRARKGIAVPGGSFRDEARSAVKRVNDNLGQHRIYDADGRFASQVARLAKAHAALEGKDAIDRTDLNQGLRFAVTARVGMISTRAAAGHKISAIVGEILNG